MEEPDTDNTASRKSTFPPDQPDIEEQRYEGSPTTTVSTTSSVEGSPSLLQTEAAQAEDEDFTSREWSSEIEGVFVLHGDVSEVVAYDLQPASLADIPSPSTTRQDTAAPSLGSGPEQIFSSEEIDHEETGNRAIRPELGQDGQSQDDGGGGSEDANIVESHHGSFAEQGRTASKSFPQAYLAVTENDWRNAIDQGDCGLLVQLLKDDPGCLWKYEKKARTALHVAAMQGCFPLAELVLVHWRGEFFPTRDYFGAVDPRSGLTAFEMANDITGNRSISELIKHRSSHGQPQYLFDANPLTWWYTCLEMGDGEQLRELLQWNSRLLLETFHGLSVLQVAIVLNDSDLVKAVVALFGSQKKVQWGESYYPSELSWETMCEFPKNNYFDLNGFLQEICNRLYTEMDVQWVMSILKSLMRIGGTALELAKKLGKPEMIALLEENSRAEVDITSLPKNSPSLPEYWPGVSAMNDFISEIWEEEPVGKKAEYEADVDFNFEAEPRLSLLRLHYAFKHPVEFKDFIEKVWEHEKISDQMGSIFHVHDGQGRTPYHILMDNYNQEKPPVWPLDEVVTKMQSIYGILDGRGRTIFDIFLTKKYILQYDISKSWEHYERNFIVDGYRYKSERVFPQATFVMFFQFALLLKNTKLAQSIWKQCLQLDSENNFKGNMYNKQRHPTNLLLIAASAGNQSILQMILETSLDIMITDTKGRTSLHHAANANLLDFEFVSGECFSTVDDLCKFKEKWQEKQKDEESYEVEVQPTMEKPKLNLKNTSNVDQAVRSNVERKACILMLLQAGVDLSEADNEGKFPNVGPSNDATHQSWWYDLVVKDTTDKKNSFNQAGNALSVVGTLVAATSYVGPLQPPMSYDNDTGYIHMGEKLVEIFMVTNTLAFYLAMASVMFAVVPSLPMPRESVMSELKRARHMVSLSLCLLLLATGMIIMSFAAASLVVIQYQHSFHKSDLLIGPSIIGWFICLIAVASFLIRLMRLMFYENATIRRIYQFSFIESWRTVGKFLKYYIHSFRVHDSDTIERILDRGASIPCLKYIIVPLISIFEIIRIITSPVVHLFYVFGHFKEVEADYLTDMRLKLESRTRL